MLLRRKNRLLIGVFFLCVFGLYANDVSRINIPTHNSRIKTIYDGHVFVEHTNKVSAYSLSAQENWFVTSNVSLTILDVRFNTVFLVDAHAELSAVDSIRGFNLWTMEHKSISKIRISYPYIGYLTTAGSLGVIDFFTGNVLWELEDIKVSSFSIMGQGSTILAQTDIGCQRIDITNGKCENLPVILSTDEFVFSWSHGSVIKRGSEWELFQLDKETVTPILPVQIGNAQQYKQYFLIVQSEENHIDMINALSGEKVYTFISEKPILAFTVSGNHLYCIDEDRQLVSADLVAAKREEEVYALPMLNLSEGFNVCVEKDKSVLYTVNDVIQLK